MYNLSIITPLFNKWNFTKSYLEDLKHLDHEMVEILLIDNFSTDDTMRHLDAYKGIMPNLRVICNEANLGFGKACNIGYESSTGSHIMFLNNDIRVRDGKHSWALDFIKHCNKNNIISPTGGKVDPKNRFQFMYETTDPSKDINYLSGWCMAAEREVWNKLVEPNNQFKGPFSEQYFCYFEDTHLSFSAKQLSINLEMVSVPVVHFGKVSSKQLNTYELYNNSKIIFNKNWN